MINIAICDDEIGMIDLISKEIEQIFSLNNREIYIQKYSNPRFLIEQFKNNRYDLVFLDISMPEIDGFKTAECLYDIHSDVKIIFVTAFDDMVYKVFNYRPVTFLKKSNLSKDLNNYIKLILSVVDDKNIFTVSDESGKKIRMSLSDIIYLEIQKNYLKVYFKDNNPIKIRKTLKSFLEEANTSKLVQIHKSYAVNMDNTIRFKGNNIILVNDETLTVGRNFYDNANKKFLDYMR